MMIEYSFALIFSSFSDFTSGPRLSLYSAVECAKACAEGCCSSFFHNAKTKTCILSSRRHSTTERLRSAPGYHYYVTQDSNWTSFDGQCYSMSDASVTFHKAQTVCSALGGFLARTDSWNDDKIMKSLAVGDCNYFWIGLTRCPGGWIWEDGSLLTEGFWEVGEPYDAGNENCVQQGDEGWNDVICSYHLHFLCEKRMQ